MKKPKETDEALVEERTIEGMRVTRTGRGCYTCHSSSQAETAYAVDIAENEGLGSCQCMDFTTRRLPRWRGTRKSLDVFRCKHIKRIRGYVLDAIIAFYEKPGKAVKPSHDNDEMANDAMEEEGH